MYAITHEPEEYQYYHDDQMKPDRLFFLLSVLLGFLLIIIDVGMDRLLLYDLHFNFLHSNGIQANEIFMRFLVMSTFVAFGFIVSRQIRKHNELVARHTEASLFHQQLLDAVPAPIFYKDLNYVYTGCNKSFVAFLGKPTEEIIGRTVYDLSPTHLADTYHKQDVELLENPGVQVYEALAKDRSGAEHNVLFHKATFLDKQGNVAGMIGVIFDITELRQAEGAQENLIIELRSALKKVKQLSGFLPICASCKKIRDDSGYWQQIERYIRDKSEAEFSHSICPDCSLKLLAEYEKGTNQQKDSDIPD
jgi:PAS domain S-box-containing protein